MTKYWNIKQINRMKISYQSTRQKVAGVSSGHHNPNTIADHTKPDQLKDKTNKLAYTKHPVGYAHQKGVSFSHKVRIWCPLYLSVIFYRTYSPNFIFGQNSRNLLFWFINCKFNDPIIYSYELIITI